MSDKHAHDMTAAQHFIPRWWTLALVVAVVVASGGEMHAAFFAESGAFNAAGRAFQDGQWERAEKEFGDFATRYPKSSRRAEAVLMQAQSRYKLTNSVGAIELLSANLDATGKLADEYRFWLAEARFQDGDFGAAAVDYAAVVKNFPKSARLLAAIYGEALSRFRLEDWPATVKLLREQGGAFQAAVKVRPNDDLALRGQLLLAEALFNQMEFRDAENALNSLAAAPLPPESAWRRQYLLCRSQRADGRTADALAGIAPLASLAQAAQRPRLTALTMELQAEILEQAGRVDEAVAAYEKNLASASPPDRRQALLKVIKLSLKQNKTAETLAKLEQFIQQHPADTALDLVQLTLGELRLKQFDDSLAVPTNSAAALSAPQMSLLEQAGTNFSNVITGHAASAHLGRAHLQRGWCRWHLGRFAESAVDFQAAAEKLEFSGDQAVARYKLAEAQARLGDSTNALKNFQLVTERHAALPEVKSTLLAPALYKLLRAALAIGDLATASAALRKILAEFPAGGFGDRAVLLYGQGLSQRGSTAEARGEFENFLKTFPGAALAAEVHLAVARTYVQDGNWRAAAAQYDAWTAQFTNSPALPQAEYDRAWLHDQAGDGARALALFTNYVARFPAAHNAMLAQNWLGDFFFSSGQFVKAEENYQRLFQNTNCPPDLAYQARLAAGRAAFARQGFENARSYFTNLVNDTKCPADVAAQALFALGDTWIEEPPADRAKPLEKFADAINAFSRVTQTHATNRLAPLAWGKIGNCHLQLASLDPRRYEAAVESYKKAMEHPQADFAARALAELGLANVLEKQSQPAAALEHYQNVLYYEKILRDGEQPYARAVKEAGLAAGRLLEEQQKWEDAVKIYQRLAGELPALRAALDKKIEKLGERLRATKN
ncbi:MAG: tetratricopeptide repeat protein [Verrucomicrobia bacterium]|nr:tetratricopeptide repeat protein [Verrucomicrobiota bacterium]